MNMDTHNRYFRDIDYNLDNTLNWNSINVLKQLQDIHQTDINYLTPYILGIKDIYIMSIIQKFQQCYHINDINDFYNQLIINKSKILCIWINSNPEINENFNIISSFFNIWHEYKRGSYHGIHEFYFRENYIILINTFVNGELQNKKPSNIPIISQTLFNYNEFKNKLDLSNNIESNNIQYNLNEKIITIKGLLPNTNCEEVNKFK